MEKYELILLAALIAWLALKLKNSIKTARDLKNVLGHGQEDEIRRQYQEIISELEVDKQVLANKIAESVNKKEVSKLTNKMSKLTDKQKRIQEAESQFQELVSDYHNHAGEIPDAKIQEDLRKYMNNKDRVEL